MAGFGIVSYGWSRDDLGKLKGVGGTALCPIVKEWMTELRVAYSVSGCVMGGMMWVGVKLI